MLNACRVGEHDGGGNVSRVRREGAAARAERRSRGDDVVDEQDGRARRR
jgi:hypothetical protein